LPGAGKTLASIRQAHAEKTITRDRDIEIATRLDHFARREIQTYAGRGE
jgi:hypothetical protein